MNVSTYGVKAMTLKVLEQSTELTTFFVHLVTNIQSKSPMCIYFITNILLLIVALTQIEQYSY